MGVCGTTHVPEYCVATVVHSVNCGFNCGLGSAHDDDGLGGAAGSGRAPGAPADGPALDAALDALPAPEAAEGCIGIPIEPVGAIVGAIPIEPIEPVGARSKNERGASDTACTPSEAAASTPLLPLL